LREAASKMVLGGGGKDTLGTADVKYAGPTIKKGEKEERQITKKNQ